MQSLVPLVYNSSKLLAILTNNSRESYLFSTQSPSNLCDKGGELEEN